MALASCLLVAAAAPALAGYEVLRAFEDPPRNPVALARGADGALYGTTAHGGNPPPGRGDFGGVFRVEADGSGFRALHTFSGPDGVQPWSVVVGPEGTVYGTTASGGARGLGTVFAIAPDGSGFRTLHAFGGTDGATPNALTLGTDGALYGTTSSGETSSGTVFRIRPDGSGFETLHEFFCPEDGASPRAALVRGPNRVLYGTTSSGGAWGAGTVFQIHESGHAFEKRHDFEPTEGVEPTALVRGAAGELYGIAALGGAFDNGTIYRLVGHASGPRAWSFAKLHDFAFEEGAFPSALVLEGGGSLYGIASGGPAGQGTVFAIGIDGTGFRTVHVFDGSTGSFPKALLGGPRGTLFGTTLFGGAEGPGGGATGEGVVFALAEGGTAFAALHTFGWGDGASPGPLVEGSDGALYGTTVPGGPLETGGGTTLFRIEPDGVFQKVRGFDSGSGPGNLLRGSDGALYGTVPLGGELGRGALVRVNEDGSGFEELHDFDITDGWGPITALTEASDGRLYGTTAWVGEGGSWIFAIQRSGAGFQRIHDLDGNVAGGSLSTLVEGSDGRLYGTSGHTGGGGTVFALQRDGSGFQVLHELAGDGSEGLGPRSLVKGSDGALYGTNVLGGTSGYGTVFRIEEDGSGFQTLHHFDGSDGAVPGARLVAGSDGILYGTTSAGGAFGPTLSPVGATASSLVATVGGSAGPARCSPPESRTLRQPVSGVIPTDPCLEEAVAYTGFVQLVLHTTSNRDADPGATQHLVQNAMLKLEGVGLTSGDRYRFGEVQSFGFHTEVSEQLGTMVTTFLARAIVTRGSDGRISWLTLRSKLVIDASGVVRVESFELTSACASEPVASTASARAAGASTPVPHRGDVPEISAITAPDFAAAFGTVFRIREDGTGLEKLHDFDGSTGAHPRELLEGPDGALYGTAASGGPGGGGVIFRIDPP